MGWVTLLNKFSLFVNQNDIIRAIVVAAMFIIIFKCSTDLLGVIKSILLAIIIVPLIWIVMNFDYVAFLIFH